uniref:Uncharacterized protein n=1 Tax=Compsopogon caeruleus TaxID=31354 RepID=A0A6T6AHD6_9RHOD|mmetsp:Transcript_10631/g.21399  ORF Transcript_10631/g.21399 Transcript_10631/m.21399 type:complete len:102 (+) Transcript_10631:360-665(+)
MKVHSSNGQALPGKKSFISEKNLSRRKTSVASSSQPTSLSASLGFPAHEAKCLHNILPSRENILDGPPLCVLGRSRVERGRECVVGIGTSSNFDASHGSAL